jgi:hypothetical protein
LHFLKNLGVQADQCEVQADDEERVAVIVEIKVFMRGIAGPEKHPKAPRRGEEFRQHVKDKGEITLGGTGPENTHNYSSL